MAAEGEFDIENYLDEEEAKHPTTLKFGLLHGKHPDVKKHIMADIYANRAAEQQMSLQQMQAAKANTALLAKQQEDEEFFGTFENKTIKQCECTSTCKDSKCAVSSACPSARICNPTYWSVYGQPVASFATLGLVPKPTYCKACGDEPPVGGRGDNAGHHFFPRYHYPRPPVPRMAGTVPRMAGTVPRMAGTVPRMAGMMNRPLAPAFYHRLAPRFLHSRPIYRRVPF
jgi:hypothetical protein